MRKNLVAWMLMLVAALGLAVPASADVIWEPENSFYAKHNEECDYEGRCYMLAAYEGSVAVRAEPNGMVLEKVENGAQALVQFIWHGDGMDWGFVTAVSGDDRAEGWAPMDDLSLVYDSQQFQEDHQQELQEGAPVDVEFHEAWLYAYPNGPKNQLLQEDERYMPFDELFTTLYTDENGLRWGYVGYYMGRRQAWVCLDDPMSEDLSTAVVETQPSASQLRQAPSVTESGSPLLLPVVLVAAVVVVTVLLIRKLYPKQKENA